MITHNDFKQKYLNTFVERVDTSALNQCMDLAIAYCEEVLGTPRSIFAGLINAYQVYEIPTINTGTRFDFILNHKWAIPKQGDILVFKKDINTYYQNGKKIEGAGHIVVVDSADINTVTVISQNDPLGSKVIMKTYNYDHVAGWLRLIKNTLTGGEIEKLEKQITDLKATEKRLIEEKDKAVRELEAKYQGQLADQSSKCQVLINNARGRAIDDAINKLNELK